MARFRFIRGLLVSTIWVCTLASPLLATTPSYDPSKYSRVFGDPVEFVTNFRESVAPKLNEYLGLSVAVSGFIWVLRSLFSS